MVCMLTSSAVDRGFWWCNNGLHAHLECSRSYGIKPGSGQTKDYEISICCFSAKHAALRRKSKNWFVRNPDNVSEWGDMSISRLLFLAL